MTPPALRRDDVSNHKNVISCVSCMCHRDMYDAADGRYACDDDSDDVDSFRATCALSGFNT
jgi:nitrite reductase/ring-hydroxylating ferredoxin subunit